jgi:hypothetical protein
MTVTTQRRQQPRFASTSRRRPAGRTESAGSIFAASLKASLVGGVSLLLLMLISLIPFQLLALLVIPGFLIVCLATGLLAGVMAGDAIENSYQGGKAGWIAGFWAGVYGGIIAMILAAFGIAVFGIPIVAFGQGVVNQFGPEQLQSMAGYGLTSEIIALSGRVFGMLIIVGVIGSLVSALISSIGGMVYPKLSS